MMNAPEACTTGDVTIDVSDGVMAQAAMTARPVDEVLDAGDVLIVGAGAAGLLTGVECQRAGLEVTVADALGIAAGQSGHHHGVRHQGSLYVGNSTAFVDALTAGRNGWDEWLDDVTPCAPRTLLPLWNEERAAHATSWWKALGFDIVPAEVPDWLRGAPAVFASTESAYDFSPAFEKMRRELLGHTARCSIRSIDVAQGAVTGVQAQRSDGAVVRLTAGAYVFAAGCGLEPLLQASGIDRGRLILRTSYMLVLRAEALPAVTLMSVEPEMRGMFTGARVDGSAVHWLVGDHQSLPGIVLDPGFEERWMLETVERLRATTTLLDGPGVSIGMYAAPKAELREAPNELSPYAVEPYGLANAVAITPTKLTLAPALARRTVEIVTRLVPARRPTRAAVVGEPLHVLPERWRSVAMRPVEELVEAL